MTALGDMLKESFDRAKTSFELYSKHKSNLTKLSSKFIKESSIVVGKLKNKGQLTYDDFSRFSDAGYSLFTELLIVSHLINTDLISHKYKLDLLINLEGAVDKNILDAYYSAEQIIYDKLGLGQEVERDKDYELIQVNVDKFKKDISSGEVGS